MDIDSIRSLRARVRGLYRQHQETQAAWVVAQFCNQHWPVAYDGPYDFEKVISQGIHTEDGGWTYRPEMIAEFRNVRDGMVTASQGKPKTRAFLNRFNRVQGGLDTLLHDDHHFLWQGNPAALQEYPLTPVSEEQLLRFIRDYYEDYWDFKTGQV